MEELQNILNKSLKEQFENGTVDKIISESITRAIKEAVQSAMFSYDSEVKKYIEDQIKSIMLGIIKETDFEDYVVKIKNLINKAIPETALPEYEAFVKNLQKSLGERSEFNQKITLEEIFKKYCSYIENENFDEDDFDDVEDGLAYVSCSVKCQEETEKGSWKNKKVLWFENSGDKDYNVKVYLKEWYDGDITVKTNYDVGDLRSLNEFELFILKLENNWINIQITNEELEDDVLIEF